MVSRLPTVSFIFAILVWVCVSASSGNSDFNFEQDADISCSLKQFQCADKKCIPIFFLCDEERDCEDGSDEDPKECKSNVTCSKDQFKCNSGKCIPSIWQCDNEKDCNDGSDEDEQICQKKVCNLDEFTCRSVPGECVPLTWMCDDNPDCSDGSDEKSCNETCRSDEFTCKNGKCIQKRWVCDLDNDCGDNSDEMNCPNITCASEFQCSQKYCIAAKWRCDGEYDCPDGKDELGCPKQSSKISFCLPEEAECQDKFTCIHKDWLCDGTKDCPDGSDEAADNCLNVTCRVDQFKCKDRSCIFGHLHCDGNKNCPDGSDEENCDLPAPKCDPKTHFDCGGGQCIRFSQVCDGRQDCPNWEDEPKDRCGVNECNVDNGGCYQKCVDTPASFYCDCEVGYKLVDNKTCKDINECEIPGTCSQLCINDKGGFKCECESGYMRDPRDLTKCKAIEGHASLLFARRRDIRKISLDHHEMTSIVNETNSATALDFVFRTGMIFWSDITDKKIYKAPIDEGNEKTTVITNDITTSDGLAVDWIYNHIYWTDSGKNTIELANFDGKMRKTLIKDGLEEPRAIALNPMEGWIFWTDWGSIPKIERAGMDGSHRQTIVSFDVKWPNGLTLDLVKRKVYWVDAKLNSISSCDYNGRNRRLILFSTDALKHPFSITSFEDWVYWTDWDKAAVFKANKFTGKEVQPVTATEMIQNPMVIHVYHPYRQPDGENHCQAVNGHCSHLCLPAPQINPMSPKISCACPDSLRMLDDGLTCVQDENITASTSNSVINPEITTISVEFIPDSTSNKSHPNTPQTESTDNGVIAGITIMISCISVSVVGGVIYFLYKHLMHRNMASMNFDNPVYRKTTEDQFSLEKNQFQRQTRPYLSTVGEEAQEPLTKIYRTDPV
ncbi:very low-density lipoprotein receptor-like isoform X2 [Diabrotica undecimpunctata]|uniref:very low-density lipoprotein receptor-like isoform X2 n=1 Tax=Diabrotica undecimpunctata TaxID=50387 RepID=UPI003B638E3C